MARGHEIIAAEAAGVARSLPLSLIEMVCASIETCDLSEWPASRQRIINGIAHPHYRILVGRFLDCWKSAAADALPQTVAAVIRTAALCEQSHKDQQSVELVWTGPDVGESFRRTEQVLLQVIDAAIQRVLVVSYAVYRIPRVCDALVRAAARGVQLSVVVETPDRIEGQDAYSTLHALGSLVAAHSSVYYWPLENRNLDTSGRAGILHVKCAVSDGRSLFLTSANLTEYAFTLNMELGILVTGGSLPQQVEDNFGKLIRMGLLKRI